MRYPHAQGIFAQLLPVYEWAHRRSFLSSSLSGSPPSASAPLQVIRNLALMCHSFVQSTLLPRSPGTVTWNPLQINKWGFLRPQRSGLRLPLQPDFLRLLARPQPETVAASFAAPDTAQGLCRERVGIWLSSLHLPHRYSCCQTLPPTLSPPPLGRNCYNSVSQALRGELGAPSAVGCFWR